MAQTPERSALPVPAPATPSSPSLIVAPAPDAPALSDLFTFMRDAELRFESLRLRLVDRTVTAAGETVESHEVWLRHPGRAKVITRFDETAARAASLVWVCDGQVVRTYDSRSGTASERPVRPRPEGITDPELPAFARVYVPRTMLPMESLPETFIHPHGFCRNVLATADLALLGTTRLRGREAYVLRALHPRRTEVLTDRPDRWLELAVDRLTGLILLLVEHVAEQVTRHGEVTDLELDPLLSDDVFLLHVSKDVRRLF
jgi:hypothetical protein